MRFLVLLAVVLVLGCIGAESMEKEPELSDVYIVPKPDLVDSHGCNRSAGKIWCEGFGRCTMGWEEICDKLDQTCEDNTDCRLPMQYAVRSSCPFTVLCVGGRCVVACPLYEHDANPQVSRSYQVDCEKDSDCSCTGQVSEEELKQCRCFEGVCTAIVTD